MAPMVNKSQKFEKIEFVTSTVLGTFIEVEWTIEPTNDRKSQKKSMIGTMEDDISIRGGSVLVEMDNFPENFQELTRNYSQSEGKIKELESTLELLLNIKREQENSVKEART